MNHMDEQKLDALLKFNEYHHYKYFNGITRGIRFKQYVGLIQVDGLTIEILPKVDRVNTRREMEKGVDSHAQIYGQT